MTPLQSLLHTFRTAAVTEREKGTYFEELCLLYLRNEPTYRLGHHDPQVAGPDPRTPDA